MNFEHLGRGPALLVMFLEALPGSSRRLYAVGFVLSQGLMHQPAQGDMLDVLNKNRG